MEGGLSEKDEKVANVELIIYRLDSHERKIEGIEKDVATLRGKVDSLAARVGVYAAVIGAGLSAALSYLLRAFK